MSNQINEGAARYQAEIAGQNPTERSAALRAQSPQQLVTDHLDLWTSTVTPKSTSGRGRGSGKSSKLELTGIKKLRELILELAVRGRLVPQNPDDEPASKLLEKIEAEKAQLIKDGKLKKQKPLAPVSEEEKPFELPEGWERIRLGNALEVINGRAYKKHEMLDSGTPLLRVGNLFTSNEWYYSDLELEPNKYIDNGDLIYAWSASFGPFIWDGGKVIYHYHIWKLEIFDQGSLYKPFAYNYLKAITEQIKASGSGIAMLHMTKERMEKLVIPLPPFAEQQRIVAKVDELMALCDQLEQQSEHQLTAHQQLTDTLLATLTDSADAQELNDNWQRLANHFDLLFSGPMGAWAIDRLKDTILQLAVMGKLVPQNPDDEPASELLKRIDDEKARLVKEGKIKKPKKLPPVSDDEKPFELPQGWEWVRLGSFIELISGQHLKGDEYSAEQKGDAIPYLTGPADFGPITPVPTRFTNEKRAVAEAGDILITCKGSGVGKTNTAIETTAISRQLMAARCILVSKSFLHLVLKTLASAFQEQSIGIAIPGISREDVTEAILILPPLAEQHRIVEKVDELFALCDQLKARLQQASETEQHLTNAIVEQALS